MIRTLLLAAILASASSIAFAEDSTAGFAITGDATRGAGYFTSLCARCHRTADRVARDLDPTDGAALAALDTFLTTHRAADPAVRADLIAFLAAR